MYRRNFKYTIFFLYFYNKKDLESIEISFFYNQDSAQTLEELNADLFGRN